MDVYQRLRELNITLPEPPPKGGIYVPMKYIGKCIVTSGIGPIVNGLPVYTGKVGAQVTPEQGQEAARITAINILATLHSNLGNLNRVNSLVKILAFVASADDFYEQPRIINAASRLFVDVLGENGEHARSAIGVNALPGNIPVEIEAIFELKDE